MALPDPMPNSEVKRRSADGSVGFPHVRVGHRRVYYYDTPIGDGWGFCFGGIRSSVDSGWSKVGLTVLEILYKYLFYSEYHVIADLIY